MLSRHQNGVVFERACPKQMYSLQREWKADVVFRTDEAVGDLLCLVDLNMSLMTLLGFFSKVYRPNTNSDRIHFWEELAGVYDWWGKPVVY